MRHGGDYVASYCAEWRHFLEAIRNDTPVECTLADGRHALQVALAAVHSAASGQPVHVAHAPATLPPLSSRSGGNPVRK
jgi:predicted dehydrogenase